MSHSRSQSGPLVSVVIPAYGAEAFIEETIASVRAQDYRPLEVLVVEDSSPDATAAVVERLAAEWNDDAFRIRLLRQPENRGGAAALRRGFAEADGAYLCWLSADDTYWGTTKLSEQVAQLAAGAVISYSQSFYQGPSPSSADNVLQVGRWHHRFRWLDSALLTRPNARLVALLFVVPINGSTVMIRRDAWERLGTFDPVLGNIDQDSDMWLRYSALGARFALIEGPAGFYRVHAGQTSNLREECTLGAAVTRIRMLMALEESGRLARVLGRAWPMLALGSRLTWVQRRALPGRYLAEAGLRTSRNPLVRFWLRRLERTLAANALVDEGAYEAAVQRARETFGSEEYVRFREMLRTGA